MLKLKAACEHCGKLLPADSRQAIICSFECTSCESCALNLLKMFVLTVEGTLLFGLLALKDWPKKNWKGNNYLGKYPAETQPFHKKVDLEEHKIFAEDIKKLIPEKR